MSDTMTSGTASETMQGTQSSDGLGDTTPPPAWYAGLADDLKGNAAVTQYATPEDAARALIGYSSKHGVPPDQLVRLPKPDDAAGNEALWNRLGRPEKVDGYGIQMGKDAPLDQAAADAFLATMHKSGPFSPGMAKAAVDWYQNYAAQVEKDATTALEAQRTAGVQALKGEWGTAYGAKLGAAAEAAKRFGGPELGAHLDASGQGNDPAVIKAWAAVAEAVAEAGTTGLPDTKGGDRRDGVMTPAEAEAELAKMGTDPEIAKALQEASHPQHDYYVQRRLKLYEHRGARDTAGA